MWREKNIYFTEHDIYFTKLMFILKNINLELKTALRTKYIFYRILLYSCFLDVFRDYDSGSHGEVKLVIYSLVSSIEEAFANNQFYRKNNMGYLLSNKEKLST